MGAVEDGYKLAECVSNEHVIWTIICVNVILVCFVWNFDNNYDYTWWFQKLISGSTNRYVADEKCELK